MENLFIRLIVGVSVALGASISVAQSSVQELEQNFLRESAGQSRSAFPTGESSIGSHGKSSVISNMPTNTATVPSFDQEVRGNARKQSSRPLTDFQKFVRESTGRELPIFGESALKKTSFDAKDLPVSADYQVMPGDEVLVRTWGGVSIDYRAVVDRGGNINIPSVGTFQVAGVKARELDGVLQKQIGMYYKNFNISTTVGSVGSVKVFVSGQALNVGVHLVPASSTLASVAMSVGQPGVNGSFRSTQLKRAGKVVASFDMYALLKEGRIDDDVQLQSGDIIYVNQVGARVALNVEGSSAAIFELKSQENLSDILAISGAEQTLIRQDTVLIEGFQPKSASEPRLSEQLTYSRAMHASLKDGDVITLFPVRQEFSNAVTLKGNVSYPARYPFFKGMRVSDLIPDSSFLIPPSYYEQRNALPRNQLEARKAAQREALQRRFANEDSYTGQSATQFSQDVAQSASPLDEEREVGLGGRTPKTYRKADIGQPSVEETVKNLLPQINWEYAVVERLNSRELKPQLITFNLRKALNKDSQEDVELMPNDVVTIFSADDASIPRSKKVALVKVSGEVNAPGYYQIQPGETLRDVLVKAGGVAPDSFLFGMRLMRKSIQSQQKEQMAKALDQAERQLQAAEAANASSALNSADAANARGIAASQRAYLDKLRTVKPDGRIVMEVAATAKSVADLPPLELEDGDAVEIPSKPSQVAVFGSVFSQGSFAYQSGRSVFDYVNKAGGVTKSSDKGSVFVVRANGTVVSAQQGWVPFVSGLLGEVALPGDAIYVPEDYERVSFMKNLMNVSTVFYQLGLGAAAVNAIKN